ncbi:cAMP and cAMP-inhibited cGMP 3',5'-cyclic phosphodiesterase 10A-like [Diadema setosum]|uniref:cAMP and cAMP-inhibited cGMP 3',5'-cyclic phosphodiesterase 10A-like n=1 Tax=Diadema setosum TaxID=31175 RepID=UPI003B3B3407
MSSPWKQLERRLPPLPGNSSPSLFSPNRTKDSPVPAVERPFSVREPRTPYECKSGILTTHGEVKHYLKENQWLVEEFVRENCTVDEVQRWFDNADKNKVYSGKKPKPDSFRKEHFLCPMDGEDIKTFLVDMVENIEDQENVPDILYQLSRIMAAAVNADESFLFMVGAQDDSLYLCSDVEDSIQVIPFAPILPGTTIAAHVAQSLQPVLSPDILGDERFPRGTGREGSLAQSVLCLPLIQPNGNIVAVLELSRQVGNSPFTTSDMQIAATYFTWVGIALDKVQVCNGLMKQREFNDFLLQVSRVIFDDIAAIDALSQHIMMFAKSLVNADRCAFFLVDAKAEELYADLFDEGQDKEGKPVFAKKSQIRFPIDKGIAGHVAKTGEVVNITDAYKDPRFNREVDLQTGYATRCILCMPIISHGEVIGVVQLINKIGADGQIMSFDHTDESNFRMFSTYCALALHYSKIYSSNRHCEHQLAVAKEQLSYYTSCTEAQVERLLNSWQKRTFTMPQDIDKFEFHSRAHVSSLCELFIYMSHRLFGPSYFDMTTLARFILTVRKNYRLIPFHNFCHAFDVAHTMYMLLMKSEGKFTVVEMLSMFIACICHDIDHRALTNSFHQKYGTPLGTLYQSSVMEQHHLSVTMDILQREGHNIFSRLPGNEFQQVIDQMKENILSTDLALFFGNHKELSKLLVTQSLDWGNDRHRLIVRSLFMTASDLCATTKLWPVQQEIVDCLYEEFYNQGDVEKGRGDEPIAMLNRDNRPNLAKEQVAFLTNICIPCVSTLVEIVPEAAPMLAGCKDNLGQWQLEEEGRTTTMWNVGASRVSNK